MNLGLSRRTDLALAALRALNAADDRRLPGARLAARIDTTLAYLPHVVAPLVQNGWVASERGPGGGYSLTASGTDVRLLEVIEATEGPAVDSRCSLRDAPCPGDHPCQVHAVWARARQILIDGFTELPVLTKQPQGAQS